MVRISDQIAEEIYGITSFHEKMENGELRFRLKSNDGSAYIKTVAGEKGEWQNSHYHKFLKETYIVQAGWMAIAKLINGKVCINLYRPGDVVTIEPFVIHNVYLAAKSIIHTVKQGVSGNDDWAPCGDMDKITRNLTEDDILVMVKNSNTEKSNIDPRFESYVAIYNNLDSLLWRIPSLFIGGAAILLGFIANIISKPHTFLSPKLWAFMFF